MTTIDTTTLPAPDIVETLDYETILAARKAALIAITPAADQAAIAATLAIESEPLTLLLQESAYREMILRARINDAARARLVAYATGADLDQLAAFYGLTRLPGETDTRFRTRLQLRIAALAGNGTAEAYRLTALSASLSVVDAAVVSPAAGAVNVAIWVAAGADSAAVLKAVAAALNADDTRLLGITVTASLAVAKPLNISARIWREPSAPVDLCATLTSTLPATIAAYSQLGRDLAVSWVAARLHVDGVSRVTLLTPADNITVGATEYITAGSITLVDEGVQW